MLIVTTETIHGKELEMLGMVKGSTVQTVNAFRDIGAGPCECGDLQCDQEHYLLHEPG